MKRVVGLLALLLACVAVEAQDIHFSQIDINPVLNNPAYSGFFDGDGRFGVIYRNQWASVTQPYQTMSASAEVALSRRRYQQDGFSLGVIAMTDKAGTLSYGTNGASLILSYFKSMGDAIMSFGAEGGYYQSGFNPSNAQMTDPTEGFDNNSVAYPTLAIGAALFVQANDNLYFKAGASAHNLNRPNISYMGTSDVYLERRLNLYGRAEWRCWDDIAVMPVAYMQWQHNNSEFVAGADFKWFISEGANNITTFTAGAHYRMLDALYLEFTLEHNTFLFDLCYDANISKLTPASYSIGAFELGVIYRLNKKQKIRFKAMPCPII